MARGSGQQRGTAGRWLRCLWRRRWQRSWRGGRLPHVLVAERRVATVLILLGTVHQLRLLAQVPAVGGGGKRSLQTSGRQLPGRCGGQL